MYIKIDPCVCSDWVKSQDSRLRGQGAVKTLQNDVMFLNERFRNGVKLTSNPAGMWSLIEWLATHSAPLKTIMGQKKNRATKNYKILTRIQKCFWPTAGRKKRKSRRRRRNLSLKQKIKKADNYLAVDTTQIPTGLESSAAVLWFSGEASTLCFHWLIEIHNFIDQHNFIT